MDWMKGVKPPSVDHSASFAVTLGNLEVGHLRREGNEWVFSYTDAFRQQSEVKPIADFPNPAVQEYRASELWPFFVLRIPSLKQPAVQRFLNAHSLREVDEVTLLREFGRRAIANPFELVASS